MTPSQMINDDPTATAPGSGPARHPAERTLHDQIRGILAEALESPGLSEEAKDTLLALMLENPDDPGVAFLKHLHLIRRAARNEESSPTSAHVGHSALALT